MLCKATREALFSPTIRIKSICRLVPHTVDKGQKADLYCELEKRNFLLEKELHDYFKFFFNILYIFNNTFIRISLFNKPVEEKSLH